MEIKIKELLKNIKNELIGKHIAFYGEIRKKYMYIGIVKEVDTYGKDYIGRPNIKLVTSIDCLYLDGISNLKEVQDAVFTFESQNDAELFIEMKNA